MNKPESIQRNVSKSPLGFSKNLTKSKSKSSLNEGSYNTNITLTRAASTPQYSLGKSNYQSNITTK